MNQGTPLKTPPQRPTGRPPQSSPERRTPTSSANALTRIMPMLLICTLICFVISVVILFVALAIAPSSDPKTEPPAADSAPEEQEKQTTPTPSAGSDAVVTPTRQSYAIGDSATYATISGIESKYAILVDLGSYEAIVGRNPDTKICPASMTKVMTLLVACEHLGSLKEKIPMSESAVSYQLEHDGSGLDWKGGEKVSVEDLLYLVFLRSDTVASITLAEYIAGSEAAFVDMMNQKAKDLGLKNTKFVNCTGLYFESDPYYSTCRDMAVIMAHALDNSLAKRIMTLTGDWYLPSSSPVEKVKATWLTDRFGGKATLDTVTVKGAKTGWETAPGACLVSYAQSNGGGKEYVMVIVGGNGLSAKSSTADVKNIYKEYAK